MNIIDVYKENYPSLAEDKLLKLIAIDAFLRRISDFYEPFMVKGSTITRLYFDDYKARIPEDIDFVYFGHIKNTQDAQEIFTSWTDKATQKKLKDGIIFKKFSKYSNWQNIDYAMNEDFPTVFGVLRAEINNKKIFIDIEISFNLEILANPIENIYPTPKDTIYLPYTAPLSIQIAWKIHQCIINPRFKDFYDLAFLVNKLNRYPDIDILFKTLINECRRDKISKMVIKKFFDCQIPNNLGDFYSIDKKLQIDKNYQWHYEELSERFEQVFDNFDNFWLFYQNAMKTCQFNHYVEQYLLDY